MLPDKTIKTSYSLLGIGALMLQKASPSETVSSLWEKVKKEETINSYEKYIKGLVFLYTIGAITYERGILSIGNLNENK